MDDDDDDSPSDSLYSMDRAWRAREHAVRVLTSGRVTEWRLHSPAIEIPTDHAVLLAECWAVLEGGPLVRLPLEVVERCDVTDDVRASLVDLRRRAGRSQRKTEARFQRWREREEREEERQGQPRRFRDHQQSQRRLPSVRGPSLPPVRGPSRERLPRRARGPELVSEIARRPVPWPHWQIHGTRKRPRPVELGHALRIGEHLRGLHLGARDAGTVVSVIREVLLRNDIVIDDMNQETRSVREEAAVQENPGLAALYRAMFHLSDALATLDETKRGEHVTGLAPLLVGLYESMFPRNPTSGSPHARSAACRSLANFMNQDRCGISQNQILFLAGRIATLYQLDRAPNRDDADGKNIARMKYFLSPDEEPTQ